MRNDEQNPSKPVLSSAKLSATKVKRTSCSQEKKPTVSIGFIFDPRSSPVVQSSRACLEDDYLLKKLKSMCCDGNGHGRFRQDPTYFEGEQSPPLIVQDEGVRVFEKVDDRTTTKSPINTPTNKKNEREIGGEFWISENRVCPRNICSTSAKIALFPSVPLHTEIVDRRLSRSSSFSSLGLGDDDSLFLELVGEAQNFDDEGFDEEHDDEDSFWSSGSSFNPFSSRDSIGLLREKS